MAVLGQVHDAQAQLAKRLERALESQDEAGVHELLPALRRRPHWLGMRVGRAGDSPLHLAIRCCPQPVVELLCEGFHRLPEERDECPDCRQMLLVTNNAGKTCLHIAAEVCRAAIIGYLLKQGACVDACAEGGWTALMLACRRTGLKACQCVRVLLDGGAEPLLASAAGWTALHEACRVGCSECVRALLERRPGGAAAAARALDGRSPLHLAALHGHEDAVALLTAEGAAAAGVDEADACGLTPLHEAVRGGHVRVVRALKRLGARLHRADKNGLSCLHFAALAGRPQVVEFLLVECRMFVDAPSKVERLTALQCAVRAGNVDCVRTLLAFGADPRRCDARGRTAEDFFSGLNNEEIEALLTEGQTTMWQPENVEAAPVHFLDSGGEISS